MSGGARGNLLWACALLLLCSAGAHALLGWPPIARDLQAAAVSADLIAGLRMGWYFGSAAMLAFAAITGLAAYNLKRGLSVPLGGLGVIGWTYLIFGLAAFVCRDFNSHFLAFMAQGALLLAAAGPGWRPNRRRAA